MKHARSTALAVSITLAAASGASATWDPPNGEWGKSSPNDLRIMTYNVRDAIRSSVTKTSVTNNWHGVVRTIALLQPDVIVFQETGDNFCGGCVDSVATLTTVFDQFLHGGPGVSVYVQAYAPAFDMPYIFVTSENDGFNRNVILSRFPFADLNGDGRATYADIPTVGFAAAWAPGGDGGIRGFQFVEIDLPDATYSGNLVVGGAHLKSGGDSSDLAQRLAAAQNVSWFIDQFYNGAGTGTVDPSGTINDSPQASLVLGPATPVVIGGDWNEDEGSNGRRGPEAWLSEGEFAEPTLDGVDKDRSDMDSTYLTAADLTGDFDTRGSATLDYLAWQDSAATLRRAIVFNSANITGLGYPTPSPEWDGLVISPGFISSGASDHLPVFIDLIVPLGTPEGGCCFGTTCQVLTEADCLNMSGTYLGDDTLCSPNPCEEMGACCTLGNCTIETQANCGQMGGEYLGAGTDCLSDPCPPVGACCNQGSCFVATEEACNNFGGLYQGDDTDCSPNPCPPLGACCTGGICSVLLEVDCDSVGGTWLGGGTNCAGNPCPPTGACCFSCDVAPMQPCPDASALKGPDCRDMTLLDCIDANGVYKGDGTLCGGIQCKCVGDLNSDNKTDVFDFNTFAVNFGSGNPNCVGHNNGDLDCDGDVDVFDFNIFAVDFGCE